MTLPYSKLLAVATFAAFLGACSAGENPSSKATDIQTGDKNATTAASLGCDTNCLEGYEHIFELSEMESVLIVPPSMTVQTTSTGLRLVGGIGDSAGFKTSGVAIELSPKLEREFQGKDIAVSVIARAIGEEPVAMGIAYSTNDQGNSGWKTYDLTSEFEVYSLEYTVPMIVAGRMDYIGFGPVPAPIGLPEIEVLAVGVKGL